jgi:hypothetical protein
MDAPVRCDACGEERRRSARIFRNVCITLRFADFSLREGAERFLRDSTRFCQLLLRIWRWLDQRVASLGVVCTNQFRSRGSRDVTASERALREAPRPQSITCFYAWTRRAEMENAETTSWGVMRRVASCRCSATRLFKAGVVSMRRVQSPRGIEPRMVPIQRQRRRAGVRRCQEHSQEILMDVSLRGQVERFWQDSDHEGFKPPDRWDGDPEVIEGQEGGGLRIQYCSERCEA